MYALAMVGTYVVLMAAAVFFSFVARALFGAGSVLSYAAAIVAVLALIAAVRQYFLPPIVAKLDDVGFRIGLRSRGGRVEGHWLDVEEVAATHNAVRFRYTDGTVQDISLSAIDAEHRGPMIRAVYDHLNAAHGYTRFELG